MNTVLFILTNAALVLLTLGLVKRMRVTGVDAWLFGLVLFATLAEGLALALGIAGLASAIPTLVATAGLALVERLWPRSATNLESPEGPPSSILQRAAYGLLAGLLLLWAYRLTADGVRFSWDDLSYHASIVGWWLQTDSVGYAPFTYQSYFPLGVELFTFWFALPTDSVAQGNLPILIWLAMIGVSALVFARRIGASYLPVALAVGCVFVSHRVWFFSNTLTANDLGLAAAILAALAAAVHPRDEREHTEWARALISGLAAGMALGSKPSIAPQLFLLTAWWIVSVFRGKTRWTSPLIFILGTCVLGAYWYFRNWFVTGNPLFPAQVGPFEGPLGPVVQQKTAILRFMQEDGFWPKHWTRFFDWPLAAGGLVVLGFIGAPIVALRGIWSKRRNEYLPLWACALLFTLIYPMQPFSGATNKPLSGFVFTWRYLTFPVAAGLTLVGAWAASSKPTVVGVVTTVFAGVFLACAVASGVADVACAVIGAGLFAFVGARFETPLRKYALPISIAVVVAFGLSTDYRFERAKENVYAFTDYWPGWKNRPRTGIDKAWRAIDELPDGSRIGSLTYQASSHVHSFPVMGSRLQHTAVTLHADGRPRDLLHKTWRTDPEHWWWEFDQLEAAVTPEKFLTNLEEADLDYVLFSRWPRTQRTPWPESFTAARMSLDREQIVFRDDYSVIWKLR